MPAVAPMRNRTSPLPIDTSTAAGKAFLSMLGVFAEFENNLRRERQMEGINAAKARGVYKGRKPSIKPDEVRRLRKEVSAQRRLPGSSAWDGHRSTGCFRGDMWLIDEPAALIPHRAARGSR